MLKRLKLLIAIKVVLFWVSSVLRNSAVQANNPKAFNEIACSPLGQKHIADVSRMAKLNFDQINNN